jgi:hypothetical protein
MTALFDTMLWPKLWSLHPAFIAIANVHNNKPQQQMTHLAGIPLQMMRIAQQNSHPYGSLACTTGKSKMFHQISLTT